MGWLEEGTICGPKTVNLGRGWVNGVHFPHRAFQPLPLPFDPLMKTRRHFLRGSSALIALPALESIGFTAFAAPKVATPPKRMAFLGFGSSRFIPVVLTVKARESALRR